MSQSSQSTKVGLFVFVSLLLLVGLILGFSKGLSLFRPTYALNLQTANVGGIKEQAQVLVGGLRVGAVSQLMLGTDGKTVMLKLRVDRRYPLREDARFVIEQSGFLGDQHVAIYPNSVTSPLLADGAVVRCEEPFNLQEAARAATSFITRVEQTAQEIREAVRRIDQTVLNDANLAAISQSMSNLHLLSVKALGVVDRVDTLVVSNTQPVSLAISNLLLFAHSMERLGGTLNATVAENRTQLNLTLEHAQSATRSVDALTRDLNDGKGLAGSLLKDADVRESFRQTVLNFSQFSSNLNRHGLFYKPRNAKTNSPSDKGGAKGGSLILQ